MSLTLAMIAKDEENCIARVLSGVSRVVDEIVIVDTGSSDRTRQIARAFGAKVTDETDESFFDTDTPIEDVPGPFTGKKYLCNFSGARNNAFAKATSDYTMWLDADDSVFDPKEITTAVNLMRKHKSDICMMPYQIDFDEQGNVRQQYFRERIVRTACGLKWVTPVHEVIAYAAENKRLHTPNCIIQHVRAGIPRAPSAVQYRNLKILQKRYNAGIRDSRELFYLGAEWANLNPDNAIKYYREYLNAGYFPEEAAHALMVMGSLLETKGDIGSAYQAYAAAHFDSPNNPDSLFALARLVYKRGDPRKCCEFIERGWTCDTSQLLMPVDPVAQNIEPKRLYAEARSKMGLPPNSHQRCFAELAEALGESLKELKAQKSIILGVHASPEGKLPSDVVIFNTEQLTSQWFTDKYVELLKNHEVWDFDAKNIDGLRKKYGIEAKLCKVGYHKCLEKIQHLAADDKDIDVLFIGSMNERRQKIIDELSTKCRVENAYNVYGKERDALIARSKVVLNMHFYDDAVFEAVRCSYLLANRVCVVSEGPVPPEFKHAVYGVPYDDLVNACLINVCGPWMAQSQIGYETFSKLKQVDYLKAALRV